MFKQAFHSQVLHFCNKTNAICFKLLDRARPHAVQHGCSFGSLILQEKFNPLKFRVGTVIGKNCAQPRF